MSNTKFWASAPQIQNLRQKEGFEGSQSLRDRRAAVFFEISSRAAKVESLPTSWRHPLAWSILLELYRARLELEVASVKTIQIASGGASATVIRHIDALEQSGWVNRDRNADDARVTNLTLSQASIQVLNQWADQRAAKLQTLSSCNH
ncbi:MarR family transcriptional regulator [Erythrobacter insulae]|uniref:MarR family transcriptional regulator n=1 Tax=Erythrobacter insulae TaxID=2584124 RepID=A0A547PCQ7_9SPHN|nr:MarR family transcriptional regulator [Erythrobacter insulae]